MAQEGTHGQIVAGAGQAAAGTLDLTAITLPAGGPWKIFSIFGQIVRATATAAQATANHLSFRCDSGDSTPNLAPNSFPLVEQGSFLGATADQSTSPLQIWDVDWEIKGKGILTPSVTSEVTVAVAPQIITGIIFGDARPERKPLIHISRTRVQVTAAALTAVGTITLPEGASRITGICAYLLQNGVLTTAEELIGFWQMQSEDQDLSPAQYPFAAAYGAGLGALIQPGCGQMMNFIAANIPIIGGARIDVKVDLNTAVTNGAECVIFLAHE